MATPLDLIRLGLTERKWGFVRDGFFQLTGDDIEVPTEQERVTDESSIDFLKQLKKMVDGYLDLIDTIDLPLVAPVKATKKTKTPKRPVKKSLPLVSDRKKSGPPVIWPTDEDEIEPEPEDEDSDVEPDFHIVHGQPKSEDGKNYGYIEDDIKEHKNDFVDDGTIASEFLDHTKGLIKVTKSKKKEYRPKVKYVKVKCGRCQRESSVHPAHAPVKLGEDMTEYVCDRCMRGAK